MSILVVTQNFQANMYVSLYFIVHRGTSHIRVIWVPTSHACLIRFKYFPRLAILIVVLNVIF